MNRILAAGLLGLSLATSSLAHAEPVKIGVITTLSGGGAGLGIDMRDAFTLAIKQSGNKDVELVIEDDAQKPELAVQIAEKMIQGDKVDLMTGIIWSNLAMAVVPNAVAQDVIYLSPNAGPSALAGANCNPNYFNVAYQNDNFHEAMGQYANKDYKNAFILAPNYPAGKDALTGFKRYYRGKVAGEIMTKLGQLDYGTEMAQLRAMKPDAVYIFLPGGMGVNFIKQFVDAGLSKNLQLYGPGFSADEDIIRAVGAPMLGMFNASQWGHDIDNPQNKRFVADFEKTYGRLPSLYASQGYDAAMLMDSAVRAVKGNLADKAAVGKALQAANFKSVRGDFKFNRNHYPIQKYYSRMIGKDAQGRITNRTLGVVFDAHQDAYVGACKL